MSTIAFSKVNQIVNDLKSAQGSAILDHVRNVASLSESHSRIVVALLELLEAPQTPADAHAKILEVLQKEPHSSIINRSSAWKLALQKYLGTAQPIVYQPNPAPSYPTPTPTPPANQPPSQQPTPQFVSASATRPCPYCAEHILADAKKCRFCNEWLSGSKPASSSTSQSKTQRFLEVELSSRALMIIGFILFFLFFSPFVACGPIDMSASEITAASVAETANNRSQTYSYYSSSRNDDDEGSIMWLSLLLIPVTAATLFITGMSMANQLATTGVYPEKPERTQVLVIITVFVLVGLGLLIMFHPILELLWGYYAVMTCLATAFIAIKRLDYV
ncbi:MAG TPA: hypothetical protein DEF47_08085 [Herpetosiphon sp.]|uniref:Zinc ribbon domain-containing protein n=1 Tax=Herpetosiphon aurantiacus (strain ATCC 23779 / DSM 785 / 114-95) TaxID=316274 RepID=A9B7D3_HERA2|nr:hypothetical protein [Herpetosiphon sp.]ABX06416.1 hypothetical protein Haur_3780 [Herpetosiphon aurantiacus DSM 785]HBW49851.1 hypothetical protein [Herpetosiphon sp.]